MAQVLIDEAAALAYRARECFLVAPSNGK